MFVLRDDSWSVDRWKRVILEVELTSSETVPLLSAGHLGEVSTLSDEEQTPGQDAHDPSLPQSLRHLPVDEVPYLILPPPRAHLILCNVWDTGEGGPIG